MTEGGGGIILPCSHAVYSVQIASSSNSSGIGSYALFCDESVIRDRQEVRNSQHVGGDEEEEEILVHYAHRQADKQARQPLNHLYPCSTTPLCYGICFVVVPPMQADPTPLPNTNPTTLSLTPRPSARPQSSNRHCWRRF